jgi:hypothetical protein
MRVINVETSSAITACGTYSWGETEDYLIKVMPTPACAGTPNEGTASASLSSLCAGNSATISLSGYSTGVTGISLQWYYSANGTDFSPVSGATSDSLATGTLSANAYYYCTVTCANSGETVSSNTVTITVSNPLMTDSIPSGRCGTGTVTLQATANEGSTINWYAAATGGAPLATGTSFTTPSISATTTYYAEATTGTTSNVGLASDTASNLSSLS